MGVDSLLLSTHKHVLLSQHHVKLRGRSAIHPTVKYRSIGVTKWVQGFPAIDATDGGTVTGHELQHNTLKRWLDWTEIQHYSNYDPCTSTYIGDDIILVNVINSVDMSSGVPSMSDVYYLGVTPAENWITGATGWSCDSWTGCAGGLAVKVTGTSDYYGHSHKFVYGIGLIGPGGAGGLRGGSTSLLQYSGSMTSCDGGPTWWTSTISAENDLQTNIDLAVAPLASYNVTSEMGATWNESWWKSYNEGLMGNGLGPDLELGGPWSWTGNLNTTWTHTAGGSAFSHFMYPLIYVSGQMGWQTSPHAIACHSQFMTSTTVPYQFVTGLMRPAWDYVLTNGQVIGSFVNKKVIGAGTAYSGSIYNIPMPDDTTIPADPADPSEPIYMGRAVWVEFL